ncbi:MAG TPA: hypothetical protein VHB23_12485, partial [Devosiaceae bacterium]|nr:hypothetical protein [Devosiaceae bacterium]
MLLNPLPEFPHPEVEAWMAALPAAQREPIEGARATLGPLLATAPYLFELARAHAEWLAGALGTGADRALAAELAELRGAGQQIEDETALAVRLRQGKGRLALLAAVAEVGGAWSTAQSTAALADLADSALDAALDFLIRRAAAKGATSATGSADSGLALFAL